MKNNLLRLFLLLFVSSSFSQAARKYSNEFLNIGVDARAFGMGNSVVASINDVNSAYWNPAGLVEITENRQVSAMHAEYFQSIAKYDYLAAAYPLEVGTVAVSLFRFGVDDILNTTELIDNQGNIDYDKISKFSTADYALALSYAAFLKAIPNLAIGANAKIVYRHIGKFATSYGFGLDLGLQYKTEDDFYFGLMARDITTTFNAWSINRAELKEITVEEPGTGNQVTVNDLPGENIELTLPKLQLGIGKKLDINGRFSLLGELDMHFRFTKTNDLVASKVVSMSPSVGLELGYDDIVFIRTGVNNFQNETKIDGNEKLSFQPNVGLGFRYRGISVDYALTNVGDQSIALYSNIFSLKIDLDRFYSY